MMLNVSRTRIPESWLSTLAKPSVGLDKEALVTLEKSRFSVSTIDSELFPELLSWSALMNALPTSQCAQSIPSDITKPGDTDTVFESNPSLSLILDPTTLDIGFDQSCFDGVDDLLIYHPFEAFADVCWLEAVGHPSPPSLRVSTPTQFLNKQTGSEETLPPPVMKPSSEECDLDVEENSRFNKEDQFSMSTIEIDVISTGSPPRSEKKLSCHTDKKSFTSICSDDEATSFILFEAASLSPNCYNSVGRFPMPTGRPHRNVSSRIPTFCSNLPATWTSVR